MMASDSKGGKKAVQGVKQNVSGANVLSMDGEHTLDKDGARASLQFAKHAGKWVAEFRFTLRAGLCRACTLPLTTNSAPFPTQAAAVADAAKRLLASKNTSINGLPLTTSQRKAIAALEAWAASLIQQANAPALLPLAGKRFLDCFAGIGGFHVALAGQGADCAGAIELDAEARTTYRNNHPGPYLIHADIRTATARTFGAVDIVCGGFPCQSFSQAGDGAGFSAPTKGALFFEVSRLIAELAPTMALLENVAGLCSHDEGRTFETILDQLTGLGYSVTTAMLNAGDFGLPQVRERLFLMCIHDRALTNRTAPYVFPQGMDAGAVVADVLEAAPTVTPCARPMVRIKPDPAADSRSIELVGHIEGKRGQGYRVASPRGKGYTLCANSGGAGPKTGLYLVGGKARTLSPREAARMQGFPESFTPNPRPAAALRQFGNSVAVPVVSAIVGALDPSIFK